MLKIFRKFICWLFGHRPSKMQPVVLFPTQRYYIKLCDYCGSCYVMPHIEDDYDDEED